jgi:hypothetical protein
MSFAIIILVCSFQALSPIRLTSSDVGLQIQIRVAAIVACKGFNWLLCKKRFVDMVFSALISLGIISGLTDG